jgi:hypothetical protein
VFKQTPQHCAAIVGRKVKVNAATKGPRLLLEDEQRRIVLLHAAMDLSLQVRQEGAVGGGRGAIFMYIIHG